MWPFSRAKPAPTPTEEIAAVHHAITVAFADRRMFADPDNYDALAKTLRESLDILEKFGPRDVLMQYELWLSEREEMRKKWHHTSK